MTKATKKNNLLQDIHGVEEASEMVLEKGLSDATIEEFGLYILRSWGESKTDLMWERLCLPIHGPDGRVIAKAGRILKTRLDKVESAFKSKYMTEELAAAKLEKWMSSKWVNEPYEKSRNLFNIHRAYNSILDSNYVIVLEGYWDVMGLYNKGIRNVVATCGTSLSKYNAYMLQALCDHCIIMFDPDDAGISAAEKTSEMLHDINMSCTIVEIESGLDPDEYVKRKKTKSLIETLDSINESKEYKIYLH